MENPKSSFPPFPLPLEIAPRFPHSNSPGGPRKSAKPKAGFPLSLGSTVPSVPNLNASAGTATSFKTTAYFSVTSLDEATRTGKILAAEHGIEHRDDGCLQLTVEEAPTLVLRLFARQPLRNLRYELPLFRHAKEDRDA